MKKAMNINFVLLIAAVVIFCLVFYLLWKYGRISRQDILALTAIIISLAIGLFTFLSRSLPIEIEVYQTSTTLFNLTEENKSLLISESLYYDLKNNISPQAQNINKQLLQNGISANINFICVLSKRQIDRNRPELEIFSNLNDFQKWLLNPEAFDYKKFETKWLFDIHDTIIIDEITELKAIDDAIELKLGYKYDPLLAELKYKFFAK